MVGKLDLLGALLLLGEALRDGELDLLGALLVVGKLVLVGTLDLLGMDHENQLLLFCTRLYCVVAHSLYSL